jgi:hypothetical protein
MVKIKIVVSELPVLLWVNDEFVEIKADSFRVPNFQISHFYLEKMGLCFSHRKRIFFGLMRRFNPVIASN